MDRSEGNFHGYCLLAQLDPLRLVYASPAFGALVGLTGDAPEAEAWSMLRLVHPQDRDRVRDAALSVIRDPRDFGLEFTIVLPDGRARSIVSLAFPIDTGENRPRLLGVLTEDVTDSRSQEAAHRESDRRFRRLFESSREGVIGSDLEGIVHTANPAAARILGYDHPAELVGLPASQLYLNPTRRDTIISLLWEQGFLEDLEVIFKRRDGQAVYVQGSATIDFDAAGRPMGQIMIFSDVTRRKMAEEALLANQRQLSALAAELALIEEKERRRIAADLHDRVGGSLFSAKMRVKALEAVSGDPQARRELGQLGKMIDQIIQDTRSLTSELALPVLYELGLEAAVEWLAEKVQNEHGLTVRVVDDGRQRPLSEEMRGLLFRSVREMLFNAVKHARASMVEIRLDKRSDHIQIQIKDDGRGFEVSRLWTDSKVSGGWGLFSIRERLSHVDGSLEIESAPDEGTSIRITLPLTGRA
jgi:PAS domain S-box-containing protein